MNWKFAQTHPWRYNYYVNVNGYSLSWQNSCLCGRVGEMEHKGHMSIYQPDRDWETSSS